MGHRFIAKVSTFVSLEDAREFLDGYNRSARGFHSAQLVDDAGAHAPVVFMLEHDTEAEAVAARIAESGVKDADV